MGDASEREVPKKKKKTTDKTKNSTKSPDKKKRTPKSDGDIGALKREFKLRKQAYSRKKTKKPREDSGADPAPTQDDAGPPAEGNPPAPSAAYQAKCQVVRHMDELAEMVASQLAVLAPTASITKDAAYELAEMSRIAITEMLAGAVEFSENGAGTPEAPLDHGQMFVGVRAWLPDALAKPLLYRAIAELGTQQGTLESAQAAFQKYAEVVG